MKIHKDKQWFKFWWIYLELNIFRPRCYCGQTLTLIESWKAIDTEYCSKCKDQYFEIE